MKRTKLISIEGIQLLVRQAEELLGEQCGCCTGYHLKTFNGDCRDDANRFGSPEEYVERTYGIEGIE